MIGTSEATLTGASITFHTTDTDDKDFDTNVTITVRQNDGVLAARISDDFGLFPNNSDSGPFRLVTENHSTRSSLESGSVEIHIEPVGDDRWTFNFFLDLVLSDGSHLSASADDVDLDQLHKQQVFGIN
jgi:hypothetical protein